LSRVAGNAARSTILCAAVYSFDGFLAFGLLLICSCAYMKRVPRLKSMVFTDRGFLYKGPPSPLQCM
jgi:hypothetical protein